MKGKIVVVGEHQEGKIASITLECISAAKELKTEAETILLLMGEDMRTNASEWNETDVDQIIIVEHPLLARFSNESYIKALLSVWEQLEPSILLCGHNDIGRSIFPYLSEKWNLPLLSNIESFVLHDNKLSITRSAYSGKLTERTEVEGSSFLITIKPKNGSLSQRRRKQNQLSIL